MKVEGGREYSSSIKFEAVYLSTRLSVDKLYRERSYEGCPTWSIGSFQSIAHRGDWIDPIYHRGEAAWERGDVATALRAWSIAAEAGMEEAQENMAYLLDPLSSLATYSATDRRPTGDLAFHYWSRSAMQESSWAILRVCDYLRHGVPLAKNSQEAAFCYRKQARKENFYYFFGPSERFASLRLAELYGTGLDGVLHPDFLASIRMYDWVWSRMEKSGQNSFLSFVVWMQFRVYLRAIMAMLHGDISARQFLLRSLTPQMRLPPWMVLFSFSVSHDTMLALVGLTALCILAVIRYQLRRRMINLHAQHGQARR